MSIANQPVDKAKVMEEIVLLLELLHTAPVGPQTQMDQSCKDVVLKWTRETPPTALDVLQETDNMVHGAMASGLVISLMDRLLRRCCEMEDTTFEDIIPLAVWRNESPVA